MTVPYVAMLQYMGGPHDGHTSQETGVWLEDGDVVSCPCHAAVYVYTHTDERGFFVVEFDPNARSVLSRERETVA